MPYEVIGGYLGESPRIVRVSYMEGYQPVNFQEVKEWWKEEFDAWCDEQIEDVKALRATEVEEE